MPDVIAVTELSLVVNDPVLSESLDLVNTQHQSLSHGLWTLIHPVAPISINSITGPYGNEVWKNRGALNLDTTFLEDNS